MGNKTESGDYIDRLEAHWEVMVMIQATAITAASRAAIQSVIDAFTKRESFSVFNQEDMDAANKRAQLEADKLTEGSDFNADPAEWVSFPYPVYGSRAWMEEQAFYRRAGQINKL